MAPNLHGLNIVHPVQSHVDPQDLLSAPPFDLSGQLDFWTNLTFDSDEPPHLKSSDDDYAKSETGGEEEEGDGPSAAEAALNDRHVTVNALKSNHPHPSPSLSPPPPANYHPQPTFDTNAFFANIGIDPFNAVPAFPNHPASIAPSIAQLLALHSAQAHAYNTPHLPSPLTSTTILPTNPSDRAPVTSVLTDGGDANEDLNPPPKRTRTRKTSISAASPPESMGISAAEDKRRRNTAASARFRLKKKEREAALEGKAKELEMRVSELERECEGLRRENGWLKGLVVGVTGAATASPSSVPTAGVKRARDEAESS